MNDQDVTGFFDRLSWSKFKAVAKCNRRADVYHVVVRHTVGFGGSRCWKVRGPDSKDAAVRAVFDSLHPTVKTVAV